MKKIFSKSMLTSLLYSCFLRLPVKDGRFYFSLLHLVIFN